MEIFAIVLIIITIIITREIFMLLKADKNETLFDVEC